MQEICNCMPFALRNGRYKVEVVDALSADILDLDVIKDEFKPSVPTVKDYLWGFFTGKTTSINDRYLWMRVGSEINEKKNRSFQGVRQRGLQSTEKMLREDTIMTGIGELTRDSANPNSLVLQPPMNGTPFYLTTMSVGSLLRKLDDRRKTYRLVIYAFFQLHFRSKNEILIRFDLHYFRYDVTSGRKIGILTRK